jgi:hypothetical protein
MALDKMTVCIIAPGEMPLDKMSCSQYSLTLDKMSIDDMAVQNNFRQNDCMQNGRRLDVCRQNDTQQMK